MAEGKQKGQEAAKSLFLPLLTLFALFASPTEFQAGARDGGARQGGAENRQAATQNEEENIPADRITIRQLKGMIDEKEDVVIIDTRDGASYVGSTVKIKGAIHITLDKLEAKMKDLPKNKLIVLYCT
ncbi:MAG TPA: rhodanese-like domain-containing protein [Blastocatellia bacterium]|nr:rhodanese-like domain-containing protein [Blastocatellia bacterium]